MPVFSPPATIVNRSSTNQSVANNTWVRVTWDTIVNDDEGLINLGTDATKLILPAGFTKVRFTAYTVWDNNSTGNRLMSIEKNDGNTQGGGTGIAALLVAAQGESGHSLTTPWIEGLSASDSFHLWVLQTSGGSLNLRGTTSASFGGFSSLMAELVA
jgi:hypothetical protein